MILRKILFACAAALTLIACGKKEETGAAESPAGGAEAANADAKSPLDAEFRLKDAAPLDVDALFALLPEGSRPTYDTAYFDEKIGATVVTNMRLREAGDDSASIARAEFYGVDLDAIERVKTAENVGPDARYETVFQKIRMFDFVPSKAEEKDLSAAIGAVEVDALHVRQGGVEGDGQGNEAARFFNAIKIDGLYFKDIEVVSHEADAPHLVVSAPDLRFVGFGDGKFDAIIGNDLNYELTQTESSLDAMRDAMGPQGALFLSGPLKGFIAPDHQHATVKTIEWRGLDFSGLLEYGLKGQEPPLTATDLISLGDIEMTEMKTFIDDRLAASIAESIISAKTFTWLAPTKVTAVTKGIVYDFTAYIPETEENALGVLRKHGLDNVAGEGSADWRWDSKKGDVGLDYDFAADGLTNFSLNIDLSGFEIDKIAAAVETGEDAAFAGLAAFNGFSMALKDETLLDAIFDLAALQMGGTGADLRQSVPAMIRLAGAQAGELNPRFPDYVEATANFVAKGGSLEISASPDEPALFLTIAVAGETAPQTLPDLLNLEIKHEE